MLQLRGSGRALAGAGFIITYLAIVGACAGTTKEDKKSKSNGAATSGSTGVGGSGGSGSGGSTMSACPIDCATIATPDCQEAQCNTATKQCEIVPVADGATCDDGVFCTVEDSCMSGNCVGGPQNDCGMNPGACDELTCDETTKTCSVAPLADGSACTPADLCQTAATCLFGTCQGTPKDCFFTPVPDDCHVAVCNPMNGMCEPVVGNEGGTCTDPTDLCTVNKTCTAGVCQGGNPKDCSQLTVGCNTGVCDTATGQCTQMAVMNGGLCDDLNPCTTGEICNNGQCNGGTLITQCISNDGCCAAGCTAAQDIDCSCNVGDPIVNGKCSLTTVCGKAPPQMFCGGNCSNNTAQFADWWCQLAGYTSAFSYTEEITGVVQCLYYNGQTNPLTSCSQVLGPTSYGLASSCTAASNILCNP